MERSTGDAPSGLLPCSSRCIIWHESCFVASTQQCGADATPAGGGGPPIQGGGGWWTLLWHASCQTPALYDVPCHILTSRVI
jgi:hypothetical protein